MAIEDQDDDTRLYLGPARNSELLEVVPSGGKTGPSWRSMR